MSGELRSIRSIRFLLLMTLGLVFVCTCGIKTPLDIAQLKVSETGYDVEKLPFTMVASFARGNAVYLGMSGGGIFRADDADLSQPLEYLGAPFDRGPRMVFASRAGDLFASSDGLQLWRRAADSTDWTRAMDVPVWRMDEDDGGNLYTGNYTKDGIHPATLFKSEDRGLSWVPIFIRSDNDHIHTVRWDNVSKRLYIAWGDKPTRGQAYSADRGNTWTLLETGPQEGHTDVAFTRDFVIWCSDDQSGRVFRTARTDGREETLTGYTQFIWFGVAEDTLLFVGTMTSLGNGGDRAALLASNDQGTTWGKLLETSPSTHPYSRGFIAESRQLSAGGWLYCTMGDANGHTSYRVRRTPITPSSPPRAKM